MPQSARLSARPIAALIAGLALAGCAAGPVPAASAGSAPSPRPRSIRGSAPAGSIASRATAFCAARSPVSLTSALSRAIPTSARNAVVPLGISADGRTGYVSAWTPGYSGVASLNLATGAIRPIRRFGDPATEQADGAWGGKWLVWEETYSLQSLDDFTVFGWNSATGSVLRLGRSLQSPSGSAWPSPWHAPAVSGDYAAWAQGYGPGGLVEIMLADLRTGRVLAIRKGHVQAPFFDGGLLVWPESDTPGSQTTLRAYSVATGRMAPLPVVLRSVRGTDFVATDGTRTAYLSPSLTDLYYSPAPGQRATIVLRLPDGIAFSNLGMAQGAIAWTTTQATYVASTASGGYVRVTPEYGFAVTGQGPEVLVADAPTAQAAHPSLALHLVSPAAIARTSCRR
jgi:hypothetical protein